MSFSKFLKVGLPAMIVGATSIAGSVLSSKFGSSEISKEVLISAKDEGLKEEVEELSEVENEESVSEEKWSKKYEGTLNDIKDRVSLISEKIKGWFSW